MTLVTSDAIYVRGSIYGHYHVIYDDGLVRTSTDTASNIYDHTHVFLEHEVKYYLGESIGTRHTHKMPEVLQTLENTPSPPSYVRRERNYERRERNLADKKKNL